MDTMMNTNSRNLYEICLDDEGTYTVEPDNLPSPLRVAGAIEMYGIALTIMKQEGAITEDIQEELANLFNEAIEEYALNCGFLEVADNE